MILNIMRFSTFFIIASLLLSERIILIIAVCICTIYVILKLLERNNKEFNNILCPFANKSNFTSDNINVVNNTDIIDVINTKDTTDVINTTKNEIINNNDSNFNNVNIQDNTSKDISSNNDQNNINLQKKTNNIEDSNKKNIIPDIVIPDIVIPELIENKNIYENKLSYERVNTIENYKIEPDEELFNMKTKRHYDSYDNNLKTATVNGLNIRNMLNDKII